jgi:hypothetical protein
MNRKTLILAIILLASDMQSFAGPSDTIKTEIFIIGVNHTGTKYRNADSLLILLRDIKPDLILSEFDTLSSYFKSDYTLVHPASWYKWARKLRLVRAMAPEDEVIYTYLKDDPSLAVYPFDMAIPNRRKYIKTSNKEEQRWLNAARKAYKKGKIPERLDSAYHSLIAQYMFYGSSFEGTYRELNRMELTDTLRQCMAQEKNLSKKLVDSVPALATYKEWQNRHYSAWEHRNDIMAMNIIRFTEKARAKRVVVFTGLLHKYYMLDRLGEERFRNQFVLIEYY